jgi:hypothetical protein
MSCKRCTGQKKRVRFNTKEKKIEKYQGCDSHGDRGHKGAVSVKHAVQKILNVEHSVHVDRIKTILRVSIPVRREWKLLGIRKHGVVIAPQVKQIMALHVVRFVLERNQFVLAFKGIVFELIASSMKEKKNVLSSGDRYVFIYTIFG